MSFEIKKSSATVPMPFLLVDSTDHITGLTGLTPTVVIRKVGGSFSAPAGAVTEIGFGWYQVAGNATDSNTSGPILLHASAAGADPVDMIFEVVDNVTSDVYGRVGAPSGVSIAADILAAKGDTAAIKTKTDNLPADPADASDIATSFGTVSTKLDTIDDFLDTEIAAIKAKTDNLPADPASNTQVNTRLATAGYTAPDNATISTISTGVDTLGTRLTSGRATNLDNLDVPVSTVGGGSLTASQIADAVCDEALSGHATAGSVGAALTTLGSANDPWTSNLGSYGAGTAGEKIILIAAYVDELETRLTSVRAGLLDNLDAAISTRLAASGYTAPDNTSVTAIKAKTDNIPAAPATAASVAAIPTNPLLTTDVRLDRLAAILYGLVTGAGTGVETFTHNGKTVRVTVDSSGNRTLVELL